MPPAPSGALVSLLRAPRCSGPVERAGGLSSEGRKRTMSSVAVSGWEKGRRFRTHKAFNSFLKVNICMEHTDTGRCGGQDDFPRLPHETQVHQRVEPSFPFPVPHLM